LFLIRHGESTWNREHRIQGQLDPPLSPDGRHQAKLLADRLAGKTFAGVYASDLQRAFQTAEVIGDLLGIEASAMTSLREIYLGEWEGLRIQEIAQRFPAAWAAWVEEPDWDVVPGGEGAVPFDARVSAALDDIFRRHEQGDVLVVTHGGVIQIALHRVTGRASRGLFPFKIQNASVSWLEKRDGRMLIGGVNDIAHLEPKVDVNADSG
jgi:broad specificity phosphatase PhoE